ncbi:hypothetical protein Q427_31570 [Halomonas sp. BC04]|nr:hypothetical protein Q427_31570 [Halomonas sp. BC04]
MSDNAPGLQPAASFLISAQAWSNGVDFNAGIAEGFDQGAAEVNQRIGITCHDHDALNQLRFVFMCHAAFYPWIHRITAALWTNR